MLVIFHQVEQVFGFIFRKVTQHVGCFVRRHVLEDVRSAFFIHVADNLCLSFGSHLFQSFSGRFVVKRLDDFGAVLVGKGLCQSRNFHRMQSRKFPAR